MVIVLLLINKKSTKNMDLTLAKKQISQAWRVLVSLTLVLATSLFAFSSSASAAQLTSRKVTIDKSAASSTDVEHLFTYTIGTTGNVGGIIYQFCTTPIGTCTKPTGMTVQSATQDGETFTGSVFTAHAVTDEGDCDMATTDSKMCFAVGTPASESGSVTHTISGITAPSSNQTVYVRISTYSLNTFTTISLVDQGVVAEAFVNQLTINARVQEVLYFCIGTDDAASANDCTDISGTTVDIGVIDASAVSISPVSSGSGGNNKNGLAMVRTNAQSGVVIVYFTTLDTSSGKLKVTGQTCTNNISTVDRCINSATGTQTAISAGTEKFGMTISSVDTTNGSTTNITRDTEYDGDGTAGGGWAWLDTGVTDQIASSSTVVDDEMLILRFAATTSITTPTGSYTAQANFIATPTF